MPPQCGQSGSPAPSGRAELNSALDKSPVAAGQAALPVTFRISSNRFKIWPLGSPTLKDTLNIPPTPAIERHRLAECRFDPRPGESRFCLSQLLGQQRRDHTDVLF